ncbi:hypothetical protein D7Z26_09125 [Cohnella endophytica]|uniref:Uncharacterized protein n=1 Tax=Cohnella endophytica TaxID=2419778 RepID=A0A494XZE2_9BACL|nr:hypothetical protein [Cohnella endophytica]RKP55349.1 hypothetical protein D7Z26_09125 [Cohnella endophytica]
MSMNRIIGMKPIAAISSVTILFLGLQGCMTSSTALSPDKAFALSASALSGVENYAFDGELSVIDPHGTVGSKAAYEGEVSGHGQLKLLWKNPPATASVSQSKQQETAYRPLQILDALNGKSTVITYAEKPVAARPIRLRIRLEDSVAKARVADGLKEELSNLRADASLTKNNSAKAELILNAADKRLQAAISTLSVETVCYWTADPKSWFPKQMREETVLAYRWDGKPYKEKRVSQTNFLR